METTLAGSDRQYPSAHRLRIKRMDRVTAQFKGWRGNQ